MKVTIVSIEAPHLLIQLTYDEAHNLYMALHPRTEDDGIDELLEEIDEALDTIDRVPF